MLQSYAIRSTQHQDHRRKAQRYLGALPHGDISELTLLANSAEILLRGAFPGLRYYVNTHVFCLLEPLRAYATTSKCKDSAS